MLTVYIVDDSRLIRERIAELVADIAGIEIVGQSGDPLEALYNIRKSHPDVVVLDIRLPHKNGIDVLKNIKENSAAPIVLMITNYPYRQYRQACMSAGADYFFSKTDEFDMILETLSRICLHRQNNIYDIWKSQKKG
jgi:two-component system response regulator DevR